MSDTEEWTCPICLQSYVMPHDLLEQEKQFHTHTTKEREPVAGYYRVENDRILISVQGKIYYMEQLDVLKVIFGKWKFGRIKYK